MNKRRPKKTLCGRNTQTIARTLRITEGTLRITADDGLEYTVHSTPAGTMQINLIGSKWKGELLMNAWTRAELLWWEAQLDAATPSQLTHLILDPDNTVVGRVDTDTELSPPLRTVPFKVNNAAQRPVPELGETYVVPGAAVRPKRMRGPDKRNPKRPWLSATSQTQ